MGAFWDYFRKNLRFSLIQRPGPLAALADGGANALDGVRGQILVIRDQFLPERCDEDFLKNFARSRGIVRAANETEAHYIDRVRFAYLWWIRGGRASLMQTTLAEYFGLPAARVVSLREEDFARWAEFWVEIPATTETLAAVIAQDQMEWVIGEIKPARSKLAGVHFVLEMPEADQIYALSTQSSEVIDIEPSPPFIFDGQANWLMDGADNAVYHN